MGIDKRIEVREAAKLRISELRKGDEVTNVCAGENNPTRHAKFVSHVTKRRKNKYDVEHTEHFAKLTGDGRTWQVGIDVVFKGRLNNEQCQELFHPIWEAYYK